MGPLAGAKRLQRETMKQIAERFGALTSRICYPAVGTTALGAIPGGLLMYGLTAQILKERGQWKDIPRLARESMAIFAKGYDGADVRLDAEYQAALPEFHARKATLTSADLPGALALLYDR